MLESTENKIVFIVEQRQNPDVFDFNIRFNAVADIHVAIPGTMAADVNLVRGVEFDVENKASYDTGAKITLHFGTGNLPSLAAMIGKRVSIWRQVPERQETELPNRGLLPSAELEKQLDKIVMMVQQNAETLTRCVKLAIASGVDPDELVNAIFSARDTAVSQATSAAQSASTASSKATAAAQSATAAHDYAEEAKRVSGITEHNQDVNAHSSGIKYLHALSRIYLMGSTSTGEYVFSSDQTDNPGLRLHAIRPDGTWRASTLDISVDGQSMNVNALVNITNSRFFIANAAGNGWQIERNSTTQNLYFIPVVGGTATTERPIVFAGDGSAIEFRDTVLTVSTPDYSTNSTRIATTAFAKHAPFVGTKIGETGAQIDMDDVTDPGVFYINAGTLTNGPVDITISAFINVRQSPNGLWIVQEIDSMTTRRKWIRTHGNTGWYPWVELSDGGPGTSHWTKVGDVYIQWGSIKDTTTITFPHAFTTTSYIVTGVWLAGSHNNTMSFPLASRSTTKCTLEAYWEGLTLNWIAIGR